MEKKPNVYLEGVVHGIGLAEPGDGSIIAKAVLRSVVPKVNGDRPLDMMEKMNVMDHQLLLKAGPKDAEFLRSMLQDVKEAEKPVYCAVKGLLQNVDGQTMVLCPNVSENVSRIEKFSGSKSNAVSDVEGVVRSVASYGNLVDVRIDTEAGEMSVMSSSDKLSELGLSGAHGLSKGDSVTVSGMLMSVPVTDGQKKKVRSFIFPRHMEKLRQVKSVRKGKGIA